LIFEIVFCSNSIPINRKENRKVYAKEKQEQKDFFGLFAMHLLWIPFAVKIVVHFVFNKTSPLTEAGLLNENEIIQITHNHYPFPIKPTKFFSLFSLLHK
jgi:hypothetical protein